MRRLSSCLLAVAALVLADPVVAIVLDDGEVHVIDASNSLPDEGIRVLDGPSSPTTVIVANGGVVGFTLQASEHSVVILQGGADVWQVFVEDSARLTIPQPTPGSGTNARIRNILLLRGEGTGNVYRAGIGAIEVTDNSRLVTRIGSTRGSILTRGNAFLELLGGATGFIHATDSSIIHICGTEFNFPFGRLLPRMDRIEGTACIESRNISNQFFQETNATIILTDSRIPAFPGWAMGALSVLLIGSTGWVMATRRRRLV